MDRNSYVTTTHTLARSLLGWGQGPEAPGDPGVSRPPAVLRPPAPIPDWATKATLTVAATAKILEVGEDCVRVAIERGELPARRFGRKVLVLGPALWRLVNGEAV